MYLVAVLPIRIVPPRPELVSALAAFTIGGLVYAATHDPAAGVVSAILIAIIVAPILIAMREFTLLSGSRNLSPEDVHPLLDWLVYAARLGGCKSSIAILYAVRRAAEIQLVYVSSSNIALGAGEEYGLAASIHRAAWQGRPVALERSGVVFLAIPTLLLERLVSMIEKRKAIPILRVRSISDAKLVYSMLRELMAASRGLKGVQLAYHSYKLFTRLVLEGRLAIDWSIAEKLERLMPFEHFWVKSKVVRQVEEESISMLE